MEQCIFFHIWSLWSSTCGSSPEHPAKRAGRWGGITLPCYLTSGRYFTVKVTSSCVPDLSLAAAGFPKVTENISAVGDKMKRKDLIWFRRGCREQLTKPVLPLLRESSRCLQDLICMHRCGPAHQVHLKSRGTQCSPPGFRTRHLSGFLVPRLQKYNLSVTVS